MVGDMSQILIWNGSGAGSFENPYVLTPEGTFDPTLPFSIKIASSEILTPQDFMYFAIPAVYTTLIFELAIFYNDLNPQFTILSRDVARFTAFNGNDNLDLVDGPYVLVNYQNNNYLLKQQLFTVADSIPLRVETLEAGVAVLREDADELLERMGIAEADIIELQTNAVREVEDTSSVGLTIEPGTDIELPGMKIKADVKISADVDNVVEIKADGVKVSKVQPEMTLQLIKIDDGNGNIAMIRYMHENGNHYQVLDALYPDGRVVQWGEQFDNNYRNTTGGIANSGHVLMANGVTQGNQAVDAVLFDESSPKAYDLLGVATVDGINVNSKSKATKFGIVTAIPLSNLYSSGVAYAEGQTLWARAGKLSNLPPAKPNLQVRMGVLINTTGSYDALIFPHIFDKFVDASDVVLTDPQINDIFYYDNGTIKNITKTAFLLTTQNQITQNASDILLRELLTNKVSTFVGNVSDNTKYPTAKLTYEALLTKVNTAFTIAGLSLEGLGITELQLRTAIALATTTEKGFLSPEDKVLLNDLRDMMSTEADADALVNRIREVLDIFSTYPEGTSIVDALLAKVDKVDGKGLSTNDLTDALKLQYDDAAAHANITNGSNPHNTSYASLIDKPTTLAEFGIVNDTMEQLTLTVKVTSPIFEFPGGPYFHYDPLTDTVKLTFPE